MADDIDIRTQVDREGRRFLAAVRYFGGDATMTEIRQRTGLARSVADWRFRKLNDLGLIDVRYAESGRGDRHPPRIAKMTGKARAAIERGLLFDIDRDMEQEEVNDLTTEIRALQEDICRVENKVDTATETLYVLGDEVGGIQQWADDIEVILGVLRDGLEACDIDVDEAIRARFD